MLHMPPVDAPPSDCKCSEVQAELEAKLNDTEECLANETKLRAAELKAMEERTLRRRSRPSASSYTDFA